MSDALQHQRDYWNKEIAHFDAIYSHRKGSVGQWLDRIFRKDMYERYAYTFKNAEPIKDREFLDVGCGTGRYSLEFARRGCRHVTGIDISEAMVEYSRKAAAAEGLADRTEFIRSDLLTHGGARMYDVAIGIGLFDYIRDPMPVLRKMHASVRDSVIASFPRSNTWRAPVRKIRLALYGCFVRFYSRAKIISMVQEAGFGSWTIEKVGKLYCITAKIR